MKNENKTDEMVHIIGNLHQYVPTKTKTQTIHVPATGDTEIIKLQSLHHLLLGGDQLTVERVKGAQAIRRNSYTATERLEGFVPVTEDWHAKVCFLQVRMSIVYMHL